MGCEINVYAHSEDLLYPTIKKKLINNEPRWRSRCRRTSPAAAGPAHAEAIGLLKQELGDAAPVGSYVLGPFTLAGQIMELNDLLKLSFKKPDKIARLLGQMTE